MLVHPVSEQDKFSLIHKKIVWIGVKDNKDTDKD